MMTTVPFSAVSNSIIVVVVLQGEGDWVPSLLRKGSPSFYTL